LICKPVLDQSISDALAQVILGANDTHLKFRSCVGVELKKNELEVTLGTSVNFNNAFGEYYMHTIDSVHRHYIALTMLRMAIDCMISRARN